MKSAESVLHIAEAEIVHPRTSGIRYVCSRCGTLLYQVTVNEAYSMNGAQVDPLEPFEVATWFKCCPNCGHRLEGSLAPTGLRIGIKN